MATVDVDGLKAINDTFGHQVGDRVLIAVAEALKTDGVTVGRYGGDQYVEILRGADREQAERYRAETTTRLRARSVKDRRTWEASRLIRASASQYFPGDLTI